MRLDRRQFLQQAGAAAAGLAPAQAAPRRVSILLDSADPIASAGPVRWAAGELRTALLARGVTVAPGAEFTIRIGGRAGTEVPDVPEALGLLPGHASLRACGSDARGAVYAVLDLADRVRHGAGLQITAPVIERPANRIRSVTRCFVSDVEDKPWYNDRSMWPEYLSMLAAQRFNRFTLAFGIGYDFLKNIRDCYFHFAYPFLLPVPGYNVRAVNLPDAERDRNLEMLKFIGEETEKRGIDFQLGLWTHGYQWEDSPHANYTIEGVTPENHADYCRDALHRVLEACPAIRGVTFRVHGESGVAEGAYSFWKTVFDGIVRCGRRINIDMHAKGMDQGMIDVALATGMPVTVSPKFWAEHMGLPYHQAAIRELEMPPRDGQDRGFFALSSGSRKFLRYSYGDLLAENRRHGVLFRVWPGTQRALLWGDPAMAAGYGRIFHMAGADGVELCEPLSFKGRKGGGVPGGRCGYADRSLTPRYDWEKFEYTYRLWGRKLYNPDAEPETWRRYLRAKFTSAAPAVEVALAHASRILPLVTSAHAPSAANNNYWPEMYTNMSIPDASAPHPYSDSPAPKVFGAVSPLDPEMFSRIDDFAAETLDGRRSARYSPLEVAQWLEDLADSSARSLARAGSQATPEFRRLALDVAIQSGLGRFFAWKLRSGVQYAIHQRTGDRASLEAAVAAYRAAREAWAALAARAREAYASDVSYGFEKQLRGHWSDRLPAIDRDVAAMEKRLAETASAARPTRAQTKRPALSCQHVPPPRFQPGRPLELSLALESAGPEARLHYRRLNQAERFVTVAMQVRDNRYVAVIPADYTQSPFPLQYYFELSGPAGVAMYPGLGPELTTQPYFVVRS